MTAGKLTLSDGGTLARLLIVDDDDGLRRRLRLFLAQHSIDLAEASNGELGLAALQSSHFDAVLLDVVMPGMDGIEVVKRIRATSDIPVLMLTARDGELDHVLGLELGADDYIAKPFRARELLARIRSVLRRSGAVARHNILAAAGIEVDLPTRTVQLGGEKIDLGGIEFDILVALMRGRGKVLPREELLAEAGRNHAMVSERTVDVHVSRLRKKLGDDPRTPRLIKTVHGIGYVFAA